MIKWFLIVTIILTVGCSAKMTITDPDGRIWKIVSKKNALVKYKDPNVDITVDNRGKLGVVESVFGVLMLKTDINLSNKEGTQ